MTTGSPERVLVLSHDATRTGAPRLLLDLLRWVVTHHEVDVHIVLRRGGPLVASFGELGRVDTLRPWSRRGVVDLVEAGLAEVGAQRPVEHLPAFQARVRGRTRRGDADLVVVNGMGGAALLGAAPKHARVAVLLHELDTGLERAATPEHRRRLWARADVIVAVSEAVAEAVVRRPEVDPAKVVVAHGFVPAGPPPDDSAANRRRELGLVEPDRPLVGSVGSGQWRKGIDLFVQLAAEARRRSVEPPRWAWVGAVDHESEVRHDVHHTGLDTDLTLVGAVSDTGPWYGAFDVMVSTAREDSFPLVGLEAGRAARPMVSFDNGGLRELLRDGRGVIVPPLDVNEMATAVLSLLAEPDRAAGLGRALRDRVETAHTIDVAAPVMWAALSGPPAGGLP